ncbi:MAG: hypothetical protein Q9227_008650 [Pyrenula ochraceoflavens]
MTPISTNSTGPALNHQTLGIKTLSSAILRAGESESGGSDKQNLCTPQIHIRRASGSEIDCGQCAGTGKRDPADGPRDITQFNTASFSSPSVHPGHGEACLNHSPTRTLQQKDSLVESNGLDQPIMADEPNGAEPLPPLEVMFGQLQQVVKEWRASSTFDTNLAKHLEENVKSRVQAEVEHQKCAGSSPLEHGLTQRGTETESPQDDASDLCLSSLRPLPLRAPPRQDSLNARKYISRQDSGSENLSESKKTAVGCSGQFSDMRSYVTKKPQMLNSIDGPKGECNDADSKVQGCSGSPDSDYVQTDNVESQMPDEEDNYCVWEGISNSDESVDGDSTKCQCSARASIISNSSDAGDKADSSRAFSPTYCHTHPHQLKRGASARTPRTGGRHYPSPVRDNHHGRIVHELSYSSLETVKRVGPQIGHRRTKASPNVSEDSSDGSFVGLPFSSRSHIKEDLDDSMMRAMSEENPASIPENVHGSEESFLLSNQSTPQASRMAKIKTSSRETIRAPSEMHLSPSRHFNQAQGVPKLSFGRRRGYVVTESSFECTQNSSSMSSAASSIEPDRTDSISSTPTTSSTPSPFPKPGRRRTGLSALAAGLGGGYDPDLSPITPSTSYSWTTPDSKQLSVRHSVSSGRTTGSPSHTSIPSMSNRVSIPSPLNKSKLPSYEEACKMTEATFLLDPDRTSMPEAQQPVVFIRDHQVADAARKPKARIFTLPKHNNRKFSENEKELIRLSMQPGMREARRKFLTDIRELDKKPAIPESRTILSSSPPPLSVEAVKASISAGKVLQPSNPEWQERRAIRLYSEDVASPIGREPVLRNLFPHERSSPSGYRGTLKEDITDKAEKSKSDKKGRMTPKVVSDASTDWDHPIYRQNPFEDWSLENSVFSRQELVEMATEQNEKKKSEVKPSAGNPFGKLKVGDLIYPG